MPVLGMVLLALVVPIAWGLLSSWAYDRWRTRQQCRCSQDSQANAGETR